MTTWTWTIPADGTLPTDLPSTHTGLIGMSWAHGHGYSWWILNADEDGIFVDAALEPGTVIEAVPDAGFKIIDTPQQPEGKVPLADIKDGQSFWHQGDRYIALNETDPMNRRACQRTASVYLLHTRTRVLPGKLRRSHSHHSTEQDPGGH